jgi:outer membrane PBP1 activator LpoA protein
MYVPTSLQHIIHRSAQLTLILMLAACAGTSPQVPIFYPEEEAPPALESSAVENLLSMSRNSIRPASEAFALEAVDILLEAGATNEAEMVLSDISEIENLPSVLQIRYALARSAIALINEEPAIVLRLLTGPLFGELASLDPALHRSIREYRATAYFHTDQHIAAVRERIQLGPLLPDIDRGRNNSAIWEVLSNAPDSTLTSIDGGIDSYELRGWLELMRLVSNNQYDIQTQINNIEQWRRIWTQHSAASLHPAPLSMLYEIWDKRPREIALVLPVQEPLGKAISEGFLSAYYDALARGQEVPRIKVYDTSFRSDVLTLYDQAVDDGVDMIIGPLLKDAVRRMQRSNRPMPVPTLALNYGDPGEGSPEGLFQFGLAPEDEIMQAAENAWEAGYRNAAVVTPGGDDYLRIQNTFVDYWTELGGKVVSLDSFGNSRDYSPMVKRVFSIDASEARAAQIRSLIPRTNIEFVPRRRQDIDFIFLLANPDEGRQIKPTLSFHFAGDVPIYAMPSIYDGGNNTAANRDLNGVIFNDAPWILENSDPLKSSVNQTWAPASGPIQRLRAMGVDAYRLHRRLEQMHTYPYIHLEGATGMLSVKSDGTIYRQLETAVIVNGVATLLPN